MKKIITIEKDDYDNTEIELTLNQMFELREWINKLEFGTI
jgi:hypothetical protein